MRTRNNNCRLMINCLLLIITFNARSQNNRQCLMDVIKFEEQTGTRNDSAGQQKNIYTNYTVKATNWDDETTISNVKMYKKGTDLHFFSEQASIYMDAKEVLVVMPYQKMLVINSNSKELNSYKVSNDFFETRKAFLDSCIVVKCEKNSGGNNILVLKAGSYSPDESIKISGMTYEYNTTSKKILSVKVNYTNEYKLKQLAVFYNEFNVNSTYKFPSFRSQFIDKKGNLKEKYSSYEIVDNREKKNKSH